MGKIKWFCLLFLLSSFLFDCVAGGMSWDPAELGGDYEDNQTNNKCENIDINRLEKLFSSMERSVDNITAEINSIISHDNYRNLQMKEAINQALLEQTKNITKQINLVIKENKVTTTDALDTKLNAMKNEMKSIISDKVDKLEQNTQKKEKELTDKINLLTSELKEKNLTCTCTTELESKKENKTNKDTLVESVRNNIDKNNTKTDADVNSTIVNKTTETRFRTNKIASLCDLVVPSTIEKPKQDIWQVNKIPIADELDFFVVAQTGCMYKGLQHHGSFYPPLPTFDGSLFEWRGALRTSDFGDIVVQWGSYSGYAFYIGLEGNKDTRMLTRYPYVVLQRRATPGILSADRYVPLYIKIQAGILTFATGCDNNEVVFTHNVTISKGDQMYVCFYPVSTYGGKHLYCPV